MAEPARARKGDRVEIHPEGGGAADRTREWLARAFTRLEDVVYIGLSLLLAGTALVLLATGVMDFVRLLIAGTLPDNVVDLLDRVLLILILVEVLYTVQVSFREHALVPEPFLIVGLIAAIRRVLVLTAELSKMIEQNENLFRNAILELALLTALSVSLVGSLMLLRRRPAHAVADRA